MSIEQANAFRKYVDENEALQQQVLEGLQDGSLKLTALAKEHGFEVTAEEALGLLDQANPETDGELELTEFELSLVSGGVSGECLVRKADQILYSNVQTGKRFGEDVVGAAHWVAGGVSEGVQAARALC